MLEGLQKAIEILERERRIAERKRDYGSFAQIKLIDKIIKKLEKEEDRVLKESEKDD